MPTPIHDAQEGDLVAIIYRDLVDREMKWVAEIQQKKDGEFVRVGEQSLCTFKWVAAFATRRLLYLVQQAAKAEYSKQNPIIVAHVKAAKSEGDA